MQIFYQKCHYHLKCTGTEGALSIVFFYIFNGILKFKFPIHSPNPNATLCVHFVGIDFYKLFVYFHHSNPPPH